MIKKKKLFKIIVKKPKYDLLNYRFLKCGTCKTLERLKFCIAKKIIKFKPRKVYKSFSNRIIRTRSTPNFFFAPIRSAFGAISSKPFSFSKLYSLFVGYPAPHTHAEKLKEPYRSLPKKTKTFFWDMRKYLRHKFYKTTKFITNDLLNIFYRKIFIYNIKNYHIVHINLTPNNISIVVTKFNGKICFWGTSGTRKYSGSRKHTVVAIEAVAKTMYRRLVFNSLKLLKVVVRGHRRKIRMRKVLEIFSNGVY